MERDFHICRQRFQFTNYMNDEQSFNPNEDRSVRSPIFCYCVIYVDKRVPLKVFEMRLRTKSPKTLHSLCVHKFIHVFHLSVKPNMFIIF
jgi:hypothetical protein